MVVHVQQNMGPTDRLVRTIAGSLLLLNGFQHIGNSPLRKIEAVIGGLFLTYGATGFDPLLSAFGASTIAGKNNNIFNLIRAAFPGQGIKPILTQYIIPKKPLRPFNEEIPIASALSIW